MKRTDFIKTITAASGILLSGITLSKAAPKTRFNKNQLKWLKIMHQEPHMETVVTENGIGFTCHCTTSPSINHTHNVHTTGISEKEIRDISTYCTWYEQDWMVTEFESHVEREQVLTYIGYQKPKNLHLVTLLKKKRLDLLLTKS